VLVRLAVIVVNIVERMRGFINRNAVATPSFMLAWPVSKT